MILASIGKCESDITGSGGGGFWGVLPQKIFCLNGVKSCNFRRNKHGNSTFINKARDSVYDGRRDNNPFELGGDSDFSNFNTMFNTGERSEPENNYENKIKISGGGGSGLPVPPPLWIRACKIQSI